MQYLLIFAENVSQNSEVLDVYLVLSLSWFRTPTNHRVFGAELSENWGFSSKSHFTPDFVIEESEKLGITEIRWLSTQTPKDYIWGFIGDLEEILRDHLREPKFFLN